MFSAVKTAKLCLLILLLITKLSAKLEIPAIFGDSMVLQQNAENAIWGWADADATIELLWQGQNLKAQADADGYWRTQLPTEAASFDAHTLRITSGPAELHISDILIGEVWLCSGQSNMQWTVANSADAKLEKAAAHHPAYSHPRSFHAFMLAMGHHIGLSAACSVIDTRRIWLVTVSA